MAKKCNSCGFQQNPDTSHYCGKCGKQLSYSDNYKLYNASLQTPVYNSTLNNYKKYERQVNSSWVFNIWDKIKGWWNKSGKEETQFWLWFSLVMAVVFGVTFFVAKSCSSDNRIKRIEINGKYGIGYNEDRILVPALYDSIGAYEIGNQWILYDNSTCNHGVAYVTDSIVNVLNPQDIKAKGMIRYSNGLSIVRTDGRSMNGTGVYLALSKGIANNPTVYENFKLSTHDGPRCIVATVSKGGMQMLGDDGLPINGKTYYNIVIDPDSMIRAIDHNKYGYTTTIHDYAGKQTSDKVFYSVNVFSDGVAWAYITAQDRVKNTLSLIDRKGNVLFAKYNSAKCIAFGDGVGWYAPAYHYINRYTAVDKTGKDLFRIHAREVYPFTMGLAPVDIGTSYSNQKLGFVDKTGKEVIPFKYKSKYNNPHFGSDSLMLGILLEGVEGKLHRNGTFIPNK